MTRRWLAALSVVALAVLAPATPSSATKLVMTLTATWTPSAPDSGTLTARWSGVPADAGAADFLAVNSDATLSSLQPPTIDWTSADGRQLDVRAEVSQGRTSASFKLPVSPSGHYYVQLVAQEAGASGQCGGTCVSNLADVTSVGAAPTTTQPPPPTTPPTTGAPRPTTTAPRAPTTAAPTTAAPGTASTTATTAAPSPTSATATTAAPRPTTTTSTTAPLSPLERALACGRLPDALVAANHALATSPNPSLDAVAATLTTCTGSGTQSASLGSTTKLAGGGALAARAGARGFTALPRLVDVQDGAVHLLEHGQAGRCGIEAEPQPGNATWWTKTPCVTVATPHAVAVLTGTEVVVTVTSTATVFEVLSGSVEVADLEATRFVRVGAGQTTTVVAGSSPIAARPGGPVTKWWSHPGSSLLARWWFVALVAAAIAAVVLAGAWLRRRGRAVPVTA